MGRGTEQQQQGQLPPQAQQGINRFRGGMERYNELFGNPAPWGQQLPWEQLKQLSHNTNPNQRFGPTMSAMAQQFNQGTTGLPITAASSVASTHRSPVGPATAGGSGITAPSSVVGAQPSDSNANAPSPTPQSPTHGQALVEALRSRSG